MIIPFVDLSAQRARLGPALERAMARVLEHGAYIMGPEVAELEGRLAAFCGARHCITCANGTDALTLTLRAEGIGAGDAVFVPAFTFAATAEAVRLVGAVPVLCDVLEASFNLDAESLAAAVEDVKKTGLAARAVIAVDLFGQPADYGRIDEVARAHGLIVIADAAQSFGASLGGRAVGTLARATATSFFPAKPLGCYGDGGAVFTDDDGLATTLRSLRSHGAGSGKYDHVRIGTNSRLDTLQAAVLIEKLGIFGEEIAARREIAARYDAGLCGVTKPRVLAGAEPVWAQYTILAEDRDALAVRAAEDGVPTAIYYSRPLSRQQAYADCPLASGGVPVAEWASEHVLSLPMHPYLVPEVQDRIMATLAAGAEGR